jgi:hypothetical protein
LLAVNSLPREKEVFHAPLRFVAKAENETKSRRTKGIPRIRTPNAMISQPCFLENP